MTHRVIFITFMYKNNIRLVYRSSQEERDHEAFVVCCRFDSRAGPGWSPRCSRNRCNDRDEHSSRTRCRMEAGGWPCRFGATGAVAPDPSDRKSTRLNSSHGYISYAVFCLKKKKDFLTTNKVCIDPDSYRHHRFV